MKWKFAFGLASDDLFFVTTRRSRAAASGVTVRSRVTTFFDEDEFLGILVRAGLRDDQTARIAGAVLLSVAQPVSPPRWTEVEVTQRQMELLRLSGTSADYEEEDLPKGKDLYLRAARSGSLPQFYDLLMQAPAALSMVTGPEHCYTFINARFAKLMGVQSIAKALGLSALDRFPGPERQRAGDLLDRVYQTGEPYLGVETRCQFFHDTSRRIEERIFNTVCQPICNAYGEVSGIMIETEDVTEMVLARAVRENREQLLFRQWAELEAIYRACPAAMMLVDARDFRILRVNEKQAELLGRGVVELLGRSLLEVAREPAELKKMLQQVLRGEPVSEHIVKGGQPHSSAAVARYWMKSCAPTLSASGKVESIILVGLEISEATRAELEPATLELEVMA